MNSNQLRWALAVAQLCNVLAAVLPDIFTAFPQVPVKATVAIAGVVLAIGHIAQSFVTPATNQHTPDDLPPPPNKAD
jgi:hypothetical protein